MGTCTLCRQEFAETRFENGQCPGCQDLTDGGIAPAELSDGYRTVLSSIIGPYRIYYGKRRLRSNRLIVYNTETAETVEDRTIGLLSKLTGVFR